MTSLRKWLIQPIAIGKSENEGFTVFPSKKSKRIKLTVACAVIFLASFGVRLLHWQDSHLRKGLESLTRLYLNQAEQIREGEGALFPRDFNNPGNAQLLVHPPGYSIFVAGIFGLFGNSTDTLTWAQIFADSVAAVMVTLIAVELFPLAVAVLSGLLVAFSPHLAHYSLFQLPDSLSALPILCAMFLIIKSVKHPHRLSILVAGCFIGISCWLRSNALLLALFVALVIPFLFERGKRVRHAILLLGGMIITISPITLRNWVVFHRFIPLSLGAGVTLIEGIGDYDSEKRFGMPISDAETKRRDIEWHSRPDYVSGLWSPDGIERDRYRFRRGLEVIRSNPLWFATVMVRRAVFMLSYNSNQSKGWPLDTARVPVVALEPGYGSDLAIPASADPDWTLSPQELKNTGQQLALGSNIQVSADLSTLEISGDESEFGDQFASVPFKLERSTDYVLRLPIRLIQGRAAAKVTSVDRRIALASSPIEEMIHEDQKKVDDHNSTGEPITNESPEPTKAIYDLAFATGNRTDALLVISNDGRSPSRPVVEIGRAGIYRIGPTTNMWTRFIRPGVRAVQRNLYRTSRMLPLVLVGGLLSAVIARKDSLVLLIVPSYYLLVQSAFHTEYRYILSIHYFLFVLAALTIYCVAKLLFTEANRGLEFWRRVRSE